MSTNLEYRTSDESEDWLPAGTAVAPWTVEGALRDNERLGWEKYRAYEVKDEKPEPPPTMDLAVGPYPEQSFSCDCGREIKLDWNGGELARKKCECGIMWFGEHTETLLFKRVPKP